jgi:hypothetical protein
MSNEFSNRFFSSACSSQDSSNCFQVDGNYILKLQNIKVHDYLNTWLPFIVICVFYNSLAFYSLYYNRFPITGIVGSDGDGVMEEEEGDSVLNGSLEYSTDIINDSSSSSSSVNGKKNDVENNDNTFSLIVSENNYLNGIHDDTNNNVIMNNANAHKVTININNVYLYVKSNNTKEYFKNQKTEEHNNNNYNNKNNNNNSNTLKTSNSLLNVHDEENLKIIENQQQQQHHNNKKIEKTKTKRILEGITATLYAGKLIALMGGSGSGFIFLLVIMNSYI